MWYIVTAIVFFLGGFGTTFFVLKNNPKLLNIEKLTEAQLKDLYGRIKSKLP